MSERLSRLILHRRRTVAAALALAMATTVAAGASPLPGIDGASPAAGTPAASAAPDRGTASASGEEDGVPAHLRAAVSHASRPEDDRRRDADRRPAEVLAFFGVEPGMTVVEAMAGSGYYVEILARALGDDGTVVAHNSPFVLQRYAEKPISDRIARLRAEGLDNIERLDTEPENPGFPGDVDVVLLNRFYHDFYWQGVDRAAFNEAVYAALKPGGVFGVVDHHAEAGSGDRDVETLHRVDAEMVKKEILAAGFVLDATSGLLAHPDDTRDWNIFADGMARRDRTDRFVYRFVKPAD